MEKEFAELKVGSFWGAIAAFFLFQIFGYILFQVFLYFITDFLMLIFASISIIVFIAFQAEAIYKIRLFFRGGFSNSINPLRKIISFIKFVLSLIFAGIFLLFLLGYYPFPKIEASILYALLFFGLTWVISMHVSVGIKEGLAEKVIAGGPERLGVFVFGLLFFVFALSLSQKFFYLYGFIGAAIAIIPLVAWLVEE